MNHARLADRTLNLALRSSLPFGVYNDSFSSNRNSLAALFDISILIIDFLLRGKLLARAVTDSVGIVFLDTGHRLVGFVQRSIPFVAILKRLISDNGEYLDPSLALLLGIGEINAGKGK